MELSFWNYKRLFAIRCKSTGFDVIVNVSVKIHTYKVTIEKKGTEIAYKIARGFIYIFVIIVTLVLALSLGAVIAGVMIGPCYILYIISLILMCCRRKK